MVGIFEIRTDLALEAREQCAGANGSMRGVSVEQRTNRQKEICVTTVSIETENGARAMGKPVGTYVTIEAPELSSPDEGYHREISLELAEELHAMMQKLQAEEQPVLVVGLGNREVTPDALGPDVVGNLCISRHMIQEYGKLPNGEQGACPVSAIVPGVMAQTGMETLEIVRGVVQETHPAVVVVIDALAARSTRRLNRTIQITDTGINPGSGVGNHRNAINRDTLGVPVIAVGVPTVVDAATIVNDTLEELLQELERQLQENGENGADGEDGEHAAMDGHSRAEQHQMIRELISPQLNTMFVTPKDIDETVKYMSYTISEGLNLAFSGKR